MDIAGLQYLVFRNNYTGTELLFTCYTDFAKWWYLIRSLFVSPGTSVQFACYYRIYRGVMDMG